VGNLVRTPDNSAVYYVGSDGKRHAFPNEKAYFTWYSDFSGVQIVNGTDIASMPLGPNMTYNAGIRMVKFQTVPKVYGVAPNGELRWIKTEEIATGLYGADWNMKIDDVSDAFYTNYTFGVDVNAVSDFSAYVPK